MPSENEEEELIEHFLCLAIEGKKATAPVLDQEVVEIQESEEINVKKRSSPQGPKEGLKGTLVDFFQVSY